MWTISVIFYLYLDGNIYRIDVAKKSDDIIASGIAFDETASSASGKMGAFIAQGAIGAGSNDEMSSMADTITMIDMSDGTITELKADPGYKIRLLGFIGEDLISGQLKITDKTITPLGMPFIPHVVHKDHRRRRHGKKGVLGARVLYLRCGDRRIDHIYRPDGKKCGRQLHGDRGQPDNEQHRGE